MNANSSDPIKEVNLTVKEAKRAQTNVDLTQCGQTAKKTLADDVVLNEGEVHFEIIGDTNHLFSPEDFMKKDAYYETTQCA